MKPARRAGTHRLSALLVTHEAEAVAEIGAALLRTNGDVRAASRELDTSHRSLFRWLEEHEVLRGVVEAARKGKR